ncbi:hypothetical protein [Segetibacter aerophilus]|uniref:Uncharacterized protein n=1 Tax=Segetibacter aerophilus TaxID=670293 RepID=A0A512BHC3_9BACT|nr:hypothetical protein [Segetibacter aerophilus]GEO11364.1 hypothetical protein SAE01_38600 [Segetibacter aerophilus]
MDKDKNKGLADNQDGEFILNESGTSVSIDTEDNFFEEDSTDEDPGETDEKSSEQKDTDTNK